MMPVRQGGNDRMTGLLIGTAGTPRSAEVKSTIGGIERVAELGLGCLELEFVRGVHMGEKVAHEVAEAAARSGIRLTAHGPYYINLNAREPDKVRASQERILKTARVGAMCGAVSVTFHAAFYMGDPPEQVYETVKKNLAAVLDELDAEGNHIWIRPEVVGKPSQFGDLEEILNLSVELERVAPCIDFAHYHARTGRYNSHDEFSAILSRIEERLGRAALDDMHIHVAGIAYGDKGERKHLDLEESDLAYVELMQALRDHDVKGVLVCESPNLEGDALLLQETYRGLKEAA
jgi:deoxyribonuclease-4